MRPRGAIRQALASAAWSLTAERLQLGLEPAGAHWRESAARARVGFAAAKKTWRNMLSAGELLPVGNAHVDHSCRPMVLCSPAPLAARSLSTATTLADALSAWPTTTE